ncbi:MAG: DUF455 family protein [Burkholderiales bacterium]|nr:MAG: DUF455 family protein [Betaproteobacteria bacterium]TAG80916.1 MAG: DUF455 family protein [Burkholderiales bacterium]
MQTAQAYSVTSVRAARSSALRARNVIDPYEKVRLTRELAREVLGVQRTPAIELRGIPKPPKLVSPKLLPQRSLASAAGRASLLHAVAHIEFNAINLALDIVARFDATSSAFVLDWLSVAEEEAYHFSLLQGHLVSLGANYGDFDAHNGLWEMAEKTKTSLLSRLALVPRTLEARGLDVSPAMREKLLQAGDVRAAEILSIILRDEVGHVAIGNRWFRYYCAEAELDPMATFERLWIEHDAPSPRPPFNRAARLAAGFVAEELDWLDSQAKRTPTRSAQ